MLKKSFAKRQQRVRFKIRKFNAHGYPRLTITRSNNNLYVQVIDDSKGHTLVSASTLQKSLKVSNGANVSAAQIIGEVIAKRSLEKGVKRVVFDKGGYKYHGRIKAVADSARNNGLII